MATASRAVRTTQADVRMIFPGVGWAGLKHVTALVGEQRVRLTYAGGDLILMSPSLDHESYVQALEDLVKATSRAFRIRIRSLGGALWERRAADAAKMPDASFYVTSVALVEGRIPDEKTDPVPDLVIEVEITHPVNLALEAYARMGVAEVWHFARRPRRAESLRFLRLEGGAWTEVASSPSLPMLESARVLPLVDRLARLDHLDRADLLDAWIRDELRPARRRRRPRGG